MTNKEKASKNKATVQKKPAVSESSKYKKDRQARPHSAYDYAG